MGHLFMHEYINEEVINYLLLINPEHVVFVLLDLEYELLYAKIL